MSALDQFLSEKLSRRKHEGLLRQLPANRHALDFFSNDYLGLARSTDLFHAIQEKMLAVKPIRNGSTGSRLLSGNTFYHEQLEEKLSVIFRSEATLLFHSGYTASLSVLSSLPQKGDTVIYDELAHACIKDGARLSLAKRFSFKHNDVADLEKKIRNATGKVFVALESIYSMDGDECPLRDVVKLADTYGAQIVLDEAHSTGAYGSSGSGLATTLGLENKIPVRIYTFGKAMGIHGACVAGSETLKQYLLNFARQFIYTTAPDYHTLASIECAFDCLAANIDLQKKLKENIRLFTKHIGEVANRTNSQSAIQTAIIPGHEQVRTAAAKLQSQGYDVRPILSPTVPRGEERLRICLHTFNSESEIIGLTESLADVAFHQSD
jgi:8-amino-7-oxononanoate synthase